MQEFLQTVVVGNIFAFLLIFMRFGTAMMIMPGIGDSFVSPAIRLLFVLAISFVLTPVLSAHLPAIPPSTDQMVTLLVSEAGIGIFIGSVMRLMLSALDVAGSIVSAQMGLSNATLFNPATDAQGSIVSAIYSSVGVTILLVSGLYGQMLAAIAGSYQLYPASPDVFPAAGDLSETILKIIAMAFKTGVGIALPFIVVGTLVQVGFGMLGRLMPQVQVFFLALPLQILASLIMLAGTLSIGILYWVNGYEALLSQSLSLR